MGQTILSSELGSLGHCSWQTDIFKLQPNLFSQVVHARVVELVRKFVSSFFLAWSVDVEHAEGGKQLGHSREVEKRLKMFQALQLRAFD